MFLIRPKPYKSETLLGYLARASSANGLMSSLQILQAIRFTISNGRMPNNKIILGEHALNEIKEAFRLSDEEVMSLCAHKINDDTYRVGSLSAPSVLFRANYPRFCPLCMRENGFIDATMLFLPKTYCIKHKIKLIDTIDGQRIKWTTPFLFERIMNYHNDEILTAQPSAATIDFNLIINDLLLNNCTTQLPEELRKLDLHEICKLIYFGIRYINKTNSSKPLVFANMTNDNLIYQFEIAYSFLTKWPESFHELLRHFEKNPMSKNRGTHGIRYCYRDLYDEIYSKQNSNSATYKILKNKFEEYLSNHFEGSAFGAGIHKISADRLKQSQLVNKTQAAKMLRCHPNKIDVYLREGLLSPANQHENNFLRLEIEELACRLHNCLTLTECAIHLGISKKNTMLLLRYNIIKPLLTSSPQNRDWLVEKSEIEQLISCMMKNAMPNIPKQTNVSSFKKLTFNKESFIDVIKKMISGEIKYILQLERNDKYNINQFKPCVKQLTENNILTPELVAKELSININAVYDWIHKGLLKAEKQKLSHVTRPITIITADELCEFTEKYVLAKNKKPDQHYQLVSGPKIDGAVVNLFAKI